MTPPRVGSCGLCGAAADPFLSFDERFSLVRCRACRHVSTDPALPEEEILPFYPPVYYGRLNRRFHPSLEALVRVFRMRRARFIERLARRGRLLDVGCGRGLLAFLMRLRGWDAVGIELSENAADHARVELGVPVFVGSIEAYPTPAEPFDVVVFWHVLEHLRDPRSALRRARALLGPGGLVVVAVPNFESLQALAGGRGWFHLDVPRHYHHFGTRVLQRLLSEEGFDVEIVSHFALEQNPYGWIQSLLNRAGFRQNLLYEVLKRDGARTLPHPVRSHPLQLALMLVALPPVVVASAFLHAAEVLLRRGGTIEVYARRKPDPPAPSSG